MGDKSSDISSKEQVVLRMRWVNDDLEIHEDFLVFQPVLGFNRRFSDIFRGYRNVKLN